MKITEHTLLEFNGSYNEGKTHYHYFVIKLGENLYYANHDSHCLLTVNDIGFALRISPPFAESELDLVKTQFGMDGIRVGLPPLGGYQAVADIIGSSRQAVRDRFMRMQNMPMTNHKRSNFPKPYVVASSSGPMWDLDEVKRWHDARSDM